MSWFPTFLNLFALGGAASLAAVPFREIGKYYFKFHATILLVLVALAVTLGKPWLGLASGPALHRTVAGLSIAFALFILLENFIVRGAGKDLRVDALLLPVSMGAIYVSMAAFTDTPYGTGQAVLLTLHLLTSAAVLGTSFVAMSTGHWYLANAQLSFAILIRLCRMFVGSLIAKAVVVALYAAKNVPSYGRLEDFYLLVVGVRIVAGVVFALALGLMSLSCAKRKANQSATGILYVAVVFVLIGETISMYLTLGIRELNIPF